MIFNHHYWEFLFEDNNIILQYYIILSNPLHIVTFKTYNITTTI